MSKNKNKAYVCEDFPIFPPSELNWAGEEEWYFRYLESWQKSVEEDIKNKPTGVIEE